MPHESPQLQPMRRCRESDETLCREATFGRFGRQLARKGGRFVGAAAAIVFAGESCDSLSKIRDDKRNCLSAGSPMRSNGSTQGILRPSNWSRSVYRKFSERRSHLYLFFCLATLMETVGSADPILLDQHLQSTVTEFLQRRRKADEIYFPAPFAPTTMLKRPNFNPIIAPMDPEPSIVKSFRWTA